MPIRIESLPDIPVMIVTTLPADRDIETEINETTAEIIRALDAVPEPVFLIMDTRLVSMDLDDIIQAASMAARGKNPVLHHPNIRENINVLTDGLIKMAAKGLDSATFGRIKSRIFDTVEDALEYCRGQIAPPEF